MNIDFKEAVMIALMNEDDGKTAPELAERIDQSTASIQSTLGKMRNHGYVVGEQVEKQGKDHTVTQYKILPKAYNEAVEIMEKYHELTNLSLSLLMDGFNGYKVNEN